MIFSLLAHRLNLILAVLAVIAVFTLGWVMAYRWQQSKIDTIKTEYGLFVAEVKTKGELAAKDAKNKEVLYAQIKHEGDQVYLAKINTLNADVKRLRLKTSTTISYLPKATGSPASAKRICFDRAKLDESIRIFDTGIQRLTEAGDSSGIGLSVAREWVKGLTGSNQP